MLLPGLPIYQLITVLQMFHPNCKVNRFIPLPSEPLIASTSVVHFEYIVFRLY